MKYTVQAVKYVARNFIYLFPFAILPAIFLAISLDEVALNSVLTSFFSGGIKDWTFFNLFCSISVLNFGNWKSIVSGIVGVIVFIPSVAFLMALLEKHFRIGIFKIVVRIFDFVLMENIAVRHTVSVKIQIINVFNALNIHCQTFQTVRQFGANRGTFKTAHLLEIGKLRHFHTVAPNFPAQAPSTQCRTFPVVFDKADIVMIRIDAQSLQTVQIQLLHVFGRGF